ncbi:helix-turn-helix transcriptional regulator [Aeromonas tecta]|uniref:helix-turn-helix transcriptional regulator n=1 Tax=Aeromonas tecta TaxID=324617 RepID=UPI00068279BC|nr:helix-turn-helix transcriptional regulator [Aeromonas tecta]
MDNLNLSAEELRDFRRVLGWSQQRMADELDVARNTVNRMEQGHMAIERRTALSVRYLAWHHSMIERIPTKLEPAEATVPVVPELGDSHKQVDLPLAFADAPEPVKKAWEIYAPVFRCHPDFAQFEPRYFKVFGSLDPDYSYLFMLQLLERLQVMAFTQSGPVSIFEMLNYKNLREYGQKLYKANPAWH